MKENEEILNGQIGGGLTEKTNELIKRNKIYGTPFEIITTEKGSFIAMGKYRVSDDITEDEAYERIDARDWELILSVIGVLAVVIKNDNTATVE